MPRRSSPLHRLATALFALWFVVVLGDPGMLHACPMHGSHGAAHAAASSHGDAEMMSHGASASHEMGATHDAQASVADAAPSHGGEHHQGAICTCVGSCCAATALAPLPTVAVFAVPVHVAAEVPAFEPVHVGIPASPDLRLPFANGPPRA